MSTYINLQPVLTMDYYFNFIVGSRRIGKSFGLKRFVFNRAVKYGEMFLYIRRYSSETLPDDMKLIFNEVLEKDSSMSKYDIDKISYRPNKNGGYWYYDSKPIGMALPLSKGITKKSNINYRFSYCIFDECLIPRGMPQHYLSNEITLFLDLIGSFTGVDYDFKKIFLLANKMSYNNPYFNYFKVPVNNDIYYKDKTRSLLIYNAEASPEFKEAYANNGFSKLIKGTKYGSYFSNNSALEDSSLNVVSKFKGYSLYNFKYKGYTLTLYRGEESGLWFSTKEDKTCTTYFITKADNTLNTASLFGNRYLIDALKREYQNNNITYQDLQVKSLCYEMFDILNIN